jgi:hypothetical protein
MKKKEVKFESPTYMVEWIDRSTNEVMLSDGKNETIVNLDNVQFLDFNKMYAIIKNK